MLKYFYHLQKLSTLVICALFCVQLVQAGISIKQIIGKKTVLDRQQRGINNDTCSNLTDWYWDVYSKECRQCTLCTDHEIDNERSGIVSEECYEKNKACPRGLPYFCVFRRNPPKPPIESKYCPSEETTSAATTDHGSTESSDLQPVTLPAGQDWLKHAFVLTGAVLAILVGIFSVAVFLFICCKSKCRCFEEQEIDIQDFARGVSYQPVKTQHGHPALIEMHPPPMHFSDVFESPPEEAENTAQKLLMALSNRSHQASYQPIANEREHGAHRRESEQLPEEDNLLGAVCNDNLVGKADDGAANEVDTAEDIQNFDAADCVLDGHKNLESNTPICDSGFQSSRSSFGSKTKPGYDNEKSTTDGLEGEQLTASLAKLTQEFEKEAKDTRNSLGFQKETKDCRLELQKEANGSINDLDVELDKEGHSNCRDLKNSTDTSKSLVLEQVRSQKTDVKDTKGFCSASHQKKKNKHEDLERRIVDVETSGREQKDDIHRLNKQVTELWDHAFNTKTKTDIELNCFFVNEMLGISVACSLFLHEKTCTIKIYDSTMKRVFIEKQFETPPAGFVIHKPGLEFNQYKVTAVLGKSICLQPCVININGDECLQTLEDLLEYDVEDLKSMYDKCDQHEKFKSMLIGMLDIDKDKAKWVEYYRRPGEFQTVEELIKLQPKYPVAVVFQCLMACGMYGVIKRLGSQHGRCDYCKAIYRKAEELDQAKKYAYSA